MNSWGIDVVIDHVRVFFSGQLEPVIDRAFHRCLEVSGPFGKIVLEVP
jgi:hypothetical protein